ncbi:hypothetical protein ACF0H5_000309 [Mactra antiquata]
MDKTCKDTSKQLETYLKQSGGCGRYQILLAITIHSMKCLVNFSMLFFMFGSAVPDWWCTDDMPYKNITMSVHLPQYKTCYVGNSSSICQKIQFDDTMNTVVKEWNLVCDMQWIPYLLTSIQMVGILFGNIVCGQLADLFGRKPPFLISYAVLILSHVGAAFSTSWTMGAVFWFLVGAGCGFFLTLQYSIMTEYSLIKWRTWLIAMPSWEIESILFALVAWLVKDWRYIHGICAVIGFPLLIVYCCVGMESFRWYVSHDRIQDARTVIEKVAKINKSSTPDLSDLNIEQDDLKDKKYTPLDLVRNRSLLVYTLAFIFIWINLGLSTYGLQFGVSALSGNLYINIFAIGLIGVPLRFVSIFGRKKAATLFNAISVLAAFAVAIEYRFEETSFRNKLTNASALISLIAIHQIWSPIQTLTVELYPTVVRNIAFGFHNSMTRVGAVIGPQLVFLDTKFAGSMYWICACTTLISALLILPLPETKERDLPDKIIARTDDRVDNLSSDESNTEEKECLRKSPDKMTC